MDKVKCECGHVNPHGTIFCEACGNSFDDGDEKKLLDMRYEGSARRSQTYKKTFIDHIWNFFSSVKVGVWLIIITLLASALGTLFPQEMYIPLNMTAEEFYEKEYGFLGKLYYQLGFHNLYKSWWYMILIASIAISLVICSLDRVVPLYKALKNQGVKRNPNFLRRQRLFAESTLKTVESEERWIDALKKRRYQVRIEDGHILAEKGRFSRWGPYVNHVGLIIFLIGAMLRFFPGMYIDDALWLRDGEIKVIPGTNGKYYLENKQFIRELYDEDDNFTVGMGMPKNYQTNAVLYERIDEIVPGKEPELKKIKEHEIRVNEPLKFEGFALYQTDFKLDEFYEMSFSLVEKSTNKSFGTIDINLANPQSVYELGNGYKVEIMSYFPNFYFNDAGEPDTLNRIPDNPAFIFKMFTPEVPEGEISFVGIRSNVEPFGENKYKMAFQNLKTRNATGLTVRLDRTIGIIIVGGIIFMIGLIQGSYWNHRRIWIQREGNQLMVAAHTNKNWYGLKKEIEMMFKDTMLPIPVDQQEKAK
ncbi:cytochrome c biogenesis protein ResB [Calidifontibacillus erzurumensis]|uniref:Cytochrome c biogenesis protein ResB n=1 Tax=Calidifontibacillus erzurumensis TaxID=2741433 RepID=A0A8J8GAS4_9BACI|nr:cytochrome c biogenesis protein ResB [Calidifontibacillus erzurumensis]NSL50475.1 cytochrome c biogenesis protein ResB [Calidifontibacillus erzurumensis]